MKLTPEQFINKAHCEVCGKVRSRRELNWHRIWVQPNTVLPTHVQQLTLHNLCEECYAEVHALSEEQKADPNWQDAIAEWVERNKKYNQQNQS